MSKDEEKITVAVKPLVSLAIGHLGDLSGDLGYIRHQLALVQNKTDWTRDEIDRLRGSLTKIAAMCSSTIEDWEEQTNVRLP